MTAKQRRFDLSPAALVRCSRCGDVVKVGRWRKHRKADCRLEKAIRKFIGGK